MTTKIQRGLRSAVTLLEVLVSMGVMSVGLLGVAALIPLGRMELAEANKMDNAATIGRWAFRDLMVQGYLQPEMWVDPLSGLQAIRPSFVSSPANDPYSLTPSGLPKSRFVTTTNGAIVTVSPEARSAILLCHNSLPVKASIATVRPSSRL